MFPFILLGLCMHSVSLGLLTVPAEFSLVTDLFLEAACWLYRAHTWFIAASHRQFQEVT